MNCVRLLPVLVVELIYCDVDWLGFFFFNGIINVVLINRERISLFWFFNVSRGSQAILFRKSHFWKMSCQQHILKMNYLKELADTPLIHLSKLCNSSSSSSYYEKPHEYYDYDLCQALYYCILWKQYKL